MSTLLLCTDGSELATNALRSGLALLRPAERVVIATVADLPDSGLVTGASGHAGAVVTPEEFADKETAARSAAEALVAEAVASVGGEPVETVVLEGTPGPAICAFASEIDAAAIVMGSRGRSGLKRAVLGSVSDHVVRNAPCPVLVTGAD